jgi:hypothetical protein
MSKLLANLFLFCDKNKDSSSKLRITNYAHIKEVTEYASNLIEFEMTPYDSLNIVVNKGEGVVSFMIQGCLPSYEETNVKLYHSNKLYLEFEFIE